MAICLNMIVRNEAAILPRCLESVRPFIDSWCIVDTGSNDGTQDKIFESFGAHDAIGANIIPGELHEREWVNFGHNRTEALELARQNARPDDFILFIDADEELSLAPNPAPLRRDVDLYFLPVIYDHLRYTRAALVRASAPAYWLGVVHEYLVIDGDYTHLSYPDATIIVHHEGARARDPDTYAKDAALLKKVVEEDPHDTRAWFYLAQSYRDAGNYGEALKAYLRRATLRGWDQEVWYSLYQAAKLCQALGANPDTIVKAYAQAYHFRPSRAETLIAMAAWYRELGEDGYAAFCEYKAAKLPYTTDTLFVEPSAYARRGK